MTLARRASHVFFVVTVAVAVLGVVVFAPVSHRGGDAHPRGDAPGFNLPDLREPKSTVSLASFRGRPIVLNFWASWCVPCRQEMPDFERVYQQDKARVAFIGIDYRDNRSEAVKFLRQTGVSYPVGYDPSGKTARRYRLVGLPTTVLISASGQVRERHTGRVKKRDLEQSIDKLFDSGGSS